MPVKLKLSCHVLKKLGKNLNETTYKNTASCYSPKQTTVNLIFFFFLKKGNIPLTKYETYRISHICLSNRVTINIFRVLKFPGFFVICL